MQIGRRHRRVFVFVRAREVIYDQLLNTHQPTASDIICAAAPAAFIGEGIKVNNMRTPNTESWPRSGATTAPAAVRANFVRN